MNFDNVWHVSVRRLEFDEEKENFVGMNDFESLYCYYDEFSQVYIEIKSALSSNPIMIPIVSESDLKDMLYSLFVLESDKPLKVSLKDTKVYLKHMDVNDLQKRIQMIATQEEQIKEEITKRKSEGMKL